MFLELSTDERDVVVGTKKYCAATAGPQLLREREHDALAYDAAQWSGGTQLGWVAPLVPEERGGGSVTGSPMRELGLVAHELGAASAPGPMALTNGVLAGLVHPAAQVDDNLLAAVVAGETQVSWAVGDGGARWRPYGSGVSATRTADGVVFDGTYAKVELPGEGGVLVVVAGTAEDPVVALVDLAAPGVEVTPLWGLDLARRWGRVTLNGVTVPQARVVATGADAVEVVERQFVVLSALLCADTCGVLDTVFTMTREWMDQRFSFGRPLASYQALKHRIADVRTKLEACRASVEAALDALDAGAPNADELVSVASAYLGEHAPLMIQECVQMHGGIGVTWEHDLHVHLRRVVTNAAAYGSISEHQRRLGVLVTRRALTAGGAA